MLDPDGRVRRNLLYWIIGQDQKVSFALKTAMAYLKGEGITARSSASNALQLGDAVFPKLQPTDGGYAQIDNGGYQILSNFRHYQYFQTISFSDVLSGKIPPNLMTDRIVLIGATASSLKNSFSTSYSGRWAEDGRQSIAGVELQAHIISQILSAALDGKTSLQVLPSLTEDFLIFSWALIILPGWMLRKTHERLFLLLILLLLASGSSYLAFLSFSLWLPIVPLTIVTLSFLFVASVSENLFAEKLYFKKFIKLIHESSDESYSSKQLAIEYIIESSNPQSKQAIKELSQEIDNALKECKCIDHIANFSNKLEWLPQPIPESFGQLQVRLFNISRRIDEIQNSLSLDERDQAFAQVIKDLQDSYKLAHTQEKIVQSWIQIIELS